MTDKVTLENQIKYYASKYYEGNPEISDEDFDDLVDKLREIDPDSYVLKSVGWGSGLETDGKKVSHKYQLIGSLQKVKDFNGIPGFSRVVSAKLDGLSAVLYYEDGHLSRAVTRGNGIQGIDITDKIVRILGGKTDINPALTCAVRGELVISIQDWESLKENNSDLKNPRNTAAGIINRNEITDELDYVSLVVYNMVGIEDPEKDSYTQEEIYNFLIDNFDKVCPHDFTWQMPLIVYYNSYRSIYPCDGLVLGRDKVEWDPSTKALVYSQIAFKFPAEKKHTTVKAIEWNMTRTGRLTPVLIVDPVELSGATVKRCTAFNAEYIESSKIGTGTVAEIMRSNEVIPYVTDIISGKVEGQVLPRKCPLCNGDLTREGVDLVCKNPDCAGKDYYDLVTWAGYIGNVDGIGTTLKMKFFNELNISCISDIYDGDYYFEGSGAQRDLFRKVLRKMTSEDVDASDALCALNIPRLGRTTADKLAEHKDLLKDCLDDLMIGTGYLSVKHVDDLAEIVGPATASSIKDHEDKYSNLIYVWDHLKFHEHVDKSEMIKVAITGKLSMKRADFEKLLEEHGFINAGIGKDTKYLITDDPNSGSSKNIKADKLGIEKITEEDFRKRYGF